MTVSVLRKSVTTRENVLLRKHYIISERGNSFSWFSFISAPHWISAASSMCSVLLVKHNTKSLLLLEFMKTGAGAPPLIASFSMAGEMRAHLSAFECL
jgi:hypothetical protein